MATSVLKKIVLEVHICPFICLFNLLVRISKHLMNKQVFFYLYICSRNLLNSTFDCYPSSYLFTEKCSNLLIV